MNKVTKTGGKLILAGLLPLLVTACGGERTVSYSQDVKPILEKNCFECHQPGGTGEMASGLNMESHESLMKGARFGPMVIAGDPEGSNMVVLMEGRADPSISMPHGKQQGIPKEDVETIRSWIKQGAKDN